MCCHLVHNSTNQRGVSQQNEASAKHYISILSQQIHLWYIYLGTSKKINFRIENSGSNSKTMVHDDIQVITSQHIDPSEQSANNLVPISPTMVAKEFNIHLDQYGAQSSRAYIKDHFLGRQLTLNSLNTELVELYFLKMCLIYIQYSQFIHNPMQAH